MVLKTFGKPKVAKAVEFGSYDPESIDIVVHWYDSIPELATVEEKKLNKSADQIALKQKGKQLLEQLAESANQGKLSSDEKWIQKAVKNGTISDKLTAATILIKEKPLSNMRTLATLIAQAKKKAGKANLPVIDRLRELFLEDLLPDRKLKYFREQDWSNPKVTDKHLVYWVFEEELKVAYASFVSILETASKDSIEFVRETSVRSIYALLCRHPEQEKLLLTLLVNKLGDPNRKVASTCVNFLQQLLLEHPNMKLVIIREIEILMLRPNILERAVYFCLIFLNQLILTKKEIDVSTKLCEIYFNVFQKFITAKDGTVEGRIMTAVLSGLNRAFPFVGSNTKDLFDSQTNELYRIAHAADFGKAAQAAMLLYQVHSAAESEFPDKYYRVLYEKLGEQQLYVSNKISMFLNLLFKSVSGDSNTSRVYAFVKRILQANSLAKPGLVCGFLFLVSELFKARPKLWTCVQQAEEPAPEGPTSESTDGTTESTVYDPFKREPKWAHAEDSCLWELIILTKHYHPSVQAFAKTIRKGEYVSYPGDPLLDFGSIAFLDKFVYKNPRTDDRLKGGSIMQSLRKRTPSFIDPIAIREKDASEVAEEDKFFHKYFTEKKMKPKKDAKVKTLESDSEEDDYQGDTVGADDSVLDDIDDEGAKEEADLFGGDDDDDMSEPEPTFDGDAGEFDYDDMSDISDGDDSDIDFNDPTEAQLEALLMQDEELMDELDEDEEEGGDSSAFAAAEEYAELLEDDVDEETINRFKTKRAKSKGNPGIKAKKQESKQSKKPKRRSSDSSKSNLGKRSRPQTGGASKSKKFKKK